MLRLVAPFIVPKVIKRELALQTEIGYKLLFDNLPPEWIPGYALADMTNTWQNYGLPISGLNYFTLGSLKNGLSTRFTPSDPMYQAWLGGYIFTSPDSVDWTPQEYLRLAEADQKKWLWRFGIEDPVMDFGKLKPVKKLFIGGKKAELFSWSGTTQSDVGLRSGRFSNKAGMEGMAYIMNKLTPGLKLRGRHFIPKSFKISYEQLTIHGFIAVVDIAPRTKSLLYVCMDQKSAETMRQMEDLISNHIQLVEL